MNTIQDHLSGRIAWRSPSNIALVKYWGKKAGQLPANPSLSITLSNAYTEMEMSYSRRREPGKDIDLDFLFEGENNPKFEERIRIYLGSLHDRFPVLGELRLEINSRNTFPHSSGIASSASSMSALGLCLATLFEEVKAEMPSGSFQQSASYLSRLASGSACRSIYGGYAVWGEDRDVPGSSDEYAIPLPFQVHRDFEDVRDAILVINKNEKNIASRTGHLLMNTHPFAESRYGMARINLADLVNGLKEGDWDVFCRITENEALMLHAMMMSSDPSFILFDPNSISVIYAIRNFRKDTGIPACFSLDAGSNVHLLYPAKFAGTVQDWIGNDLLKYCQDQLWIDDRLGNGPVRF